MNTIFKSFCLGLIAALLVLGACSCKKTHSPVDGESPTPTSTPRSALSDVNGSSFILPCGAILPCSINGSSITLACPTPVDLSGILRINGTSFYACAAPSVFPPNPGFTSVTLVSSVCSSAVVTCSGPVSCYGDFNGENLTIGCGDPLPCRANACAITITCPTLTDLSYMWSANDVKIYMHQAPCKLPMSFNGSSIVLF